MSFATTSFADAVAANGVVSAGIAPALFLLLGIAAIVAIGLLVYGGILTSASAGHPERLAHAKQVIRGAIIGLVVITLASTFTSLLSHSYETAGQSTASLTAPVVTPPATSEGSGSLTDIIVSAVVGLLRNILDQSFSSATTTVTSLLASTPLMAQTPAVLNVWLVIVGITDALFVLLVVLLGFRIMSGSVLGLGEVSLRRLLPQLVGVFLLIHVSLFLIDGLISLANLMISAVGSGFGYGDIFTVLGSVNATNPAMQIGALIVFLVLLILLFLLAVYYLMRLVVLFVGAVLSPLVALLFLIPLYRDFAIAAMRTYITTIFILFVHVVILALASSLFAGIATATGNVPNAIFIGLLGIATMLSILKAQHVLNQLSFVSSGYRNVRRLGGQFVNSTAAMAGRISTGVRRPAPTATLVQPAMRVKRAKA